MLAAGKRAGIRGFAKEMVSGVTPSVAIALAGVVMKYICFVCVHNMRKNTIGSGGSVCS